MNIDANRAATIASLEAELRDAQQRVQEQHVEITRLRAELEALRSVAGDVERAAIRAECDAFAVSRGRPCSYPDCACSTNLRSQYEVPARAVLAAVVPAIRAEERNYQARVDAWMQACFGPEISADTRERNHRFLEEALELVQANDCTRSEAHQLVDYVFGRPIGEPDQECGGVMVTLAALCNVRGLDMRATAEKELARVWTKVEQIRAKQAAKPKHSPLPGPTIRAGGNDGR